MSDFSSSHEIWDYLKQGGKVVNTRNGKIVFMENGKVNFLYAFIYPRDWEKYKKTTMTKKEN